MKDPGFQPTDVCYDNFLTTTEQHSMHCLDTSTRKTVPDLVNSQCCACSTGLRSVGGVSDCMLNTEVVSSVIFVGFWDVLVRCFYILQSHTWNMFFRLIRQCFSSNMLKMWHETWKTMLFKTKLYTLNRPEFGWWPVKDVFGGWSTGDLRGSLIHLNLKDDFTFSKSFFKQNSNAQREVKVKWGSFSLILKGHEVSAEETGMKVARCGLTR